MLFEEWLDRLRQRFDNPLLHDHRARRIATAALFFVLLTVILFASLRPQQYDLKIGDPAPEDILAPREVVNQASTARLRREAADRVPPVYRASPVISRQAAEEVGRAFSEVRRIRAMTGIDEPARLDRLRLTLPGLSDDSLRAALRASDADLTLVERATLDALDTVLSQPISSSVVDVYRGRVDAQLERVAADPNLRLFARDVARAQVRTNLEIDLAAMDQRKKEAADQVPEQVVKTRQKIVGNGDPVTAEQMDLLRQLGLVGTVSNARVIAGAALFAAIVLALVSAYIYGLRADLMGSNRKLVLVGLVASLTLLVTVLARNWYAYMLPLAMGPMVLALLLDAKIAIMIAIALSLCMGGSTMGDLSISLITAAGAIAGSFTLSRVEHRTQILRAGLWSGLAQAVMTLALFLVRGRLLPGGMSGTQWLQVLMGLVSGIVAAVAAMGLLPFFEGAFGVLTTLKLLELGNPNHPLLKKLLVEAPGSYHHTILVANLCEAGAEAIGADQVLARVGAYYHDIGKAKRPYFFTENQFGGENPHDKLPPSLSALIIASHVKDGVEMAREYKLPPEIIRFITEHHGTTLISYFYHKASETGKSEYVLEDDFRYDGPKPQSKETAVLMLADGCEASVRALHQRGNLTPDLIETQVKKIISDRLTQGQLEECDLTLRDLTLIERTFVKVLGGVHHARIEYPNMETNPTEAGKAIGGDLDSGRAGQVAVDGGPAGAGAQSDSAGS